MSRMIHVARVGALLAGAGAVIGLAACEPDAKVVAPAAVTTHSVLESYAAIGNSITAGYQSGGINDSTQRESFAFYLAQAANTRYAYASLQKPGCPPPYNNFMTQARGTDPTTKQPATSTTCLLRANNPATLNNEAVPGAASVDPTATTSPYSNTLTTLILGGMTQVQRALQVDPTFMTIWIGNNDVLPAIAGDSATVANVTPPATFAANYKAMTDAISAGAHRLKGGVMLGVVNVTNVPQLFPATALTDPVYLAKLSGAAGLPAGTNITVHPNCLTAPGNQSLINLNIVRAIRGQQHPPVIACRRHTSVQLSPTLTVQIGDALVLDTEEQASLSSTVAAYNATIKSSADAMKFIYIDPNALLAGLKTQGAVPTKPDPTVANPFAGPAGAYMSYDGIHPARLAHETIANVLIDSVNTRYGTTMSKVAVK